jgi:hypothetical protein
MVTPRLLRGAVCAFAVTAVLLWAGPARVGRHGDVRRAKDREASPESITLINAARPQSELAAGLAPADLARPRSEPSSGEPDDLPVALGSGGRVSVKPTEGSADQLSECRSTPLSAVALASALYEGYIAQFGEPPRIERLACAWAQCALENARGAIIYDNNIGNVTTQGGQRSCAKRIHERVSKSPDRWEILTVRFRSFDTPVEGAAAYWRLLAKSYNSVIALCDAADARGAAVRLSELGYFTGASEPYVAGMASLFAYANRKLRGSNFLAPDSL